MRGTVKFFNEAKGYGFIVRDDGLGDVFVHRTDLPPSLSTLYENQTVSFELEKTRRGVRAINLTVIAESEPPPALKPVDVGGLNALDAISAALGALGVHPVTSQQELAQAGLVVKALDDAGYRIVAKGQAA